MVLLKWVILCVGFVGSVALASPSVCEPHKDVPRINFKESHEEIFFHYNQMPDIEAVVEKGPTGQRFYVAFGEVCNRYFYDVYYIGDGVRLSWSRRYYSNRAIAAIGVDIMYDSNILMAFEYKGARKGRMVVHDPGGRVIIDAERTDMFTSVFPGPVISKAQAIKINGDGVLTVSDSGELRWEIGNRMTRSRFPMIGDRLMVFAQSRKKTVGDKLKVIAIRTEFIRY